MRNQITVAEPLPVIRSLERIYIESIIIVFLATIVSVAGLVFKSTIYPTQALQKFFLANDLVNLIVGLPILLASLWLARRGKVVGLLLWPGALLFLVYNYLAYLFGIPLAGVSLLYLAIVLLSSFTIFDLLRSIDSTSVKVRLSGIVPTRFAGWVLSVFGLLFSFRAMGILARASTNPGALPVSEIGVLIADLIVSALWVAGGVLLIRRKPLGYASGLGLLFAASMLFVGLILFFVLQPILTDVPFAPVDVIVVSIMGLVCFIPFVLFLRGVLAQENNL
jgi:hypothetical protein